MPANDKQPPMKRRRMEKEPTQAHQTLFFSDDVLQCVASYLTWTDCMQVRRVNQQFNQQFFKAAETHYPSLDYQAHCQMTPLDVSLMHTQPVSLSLVKNFKPILFDVLPNDEILSITPCGDKIQFWSAYTGQYLDTLAAKVENPLYILAISNQAFSVISLQSATAKKNCQIEVTYWHRNSKACLNRFTVDYHEHGTVLALPKQQLAVAYQNQVQIYDLTTGEKLQSFVHRDPLSERYSLTLTKLYYHYTGHLFAVFCQQRATLASVYSQEGYEYDNITFTACWNIQSAKCLYASHVRKAVSDLQIPPQEHLHGFPNNLAHSVWRPGDGIQLVNLPRAMLEFTATDCDVVQHNRHFKPLTVQSLCAKPLTAIKPLRNGNLIVNTQDGKLFICTFPSQQETLVPSASYRK